MPAYKDKERNTWYAKFQYKDWTGKNKTKLKRGFKTKKEALAYERDFLSAHSSSDITVKKLVELFLEDKKKTVKSNTYRKYEYELKIYAIPYFGDYPCCEVTELMIRNWHISIAESKEKRHSSIASIHSIFSRVFNFGIRYYGLTKNPLTHETVPSGMGSRSRDMIVWSPEQYKTFREALDDDNYGLMYDTLYYSGMRIGECLALKWDDVSWEDHKLRIDENLQSDEITTPKTETSSRTIKMPDFYMKELEEYYSKIYHPLSDDRIFAWSSNSCCVRSHLKIRAQRFGLPVISTHDLRHSHASMMIEMGVPITLISQRLGHKDVTVTLNKYAHLLPNTEDDFIAKLDSNVSNLYHT